MKLFVSQGPHTSAKETSTSIMQKVVIATIPAILASVLIFGVNAALLIAVTVASSVGFEYLYQKAFKLPITIGDYSAVVTGILLAFNLPPSLPLWMAVLAAFVAIVVTKQLFGGIGFNFANPAIVSRIVMTLSFTSYMNTWVFPQSFANSDVLATATPLAAYRAGAQVPVMDMLLGTTGGVLGETSAIALILGGLYLVITKVITPTIPLTYIGGVAVMAVLLGQDPVVYVLGGGLLLGAIFMATDYTTSPYTTKGKIIFGLGLAFITVMIRAFGSTTEGVSFAILIMNILVPYINRATRQKTLDGEPDTKTKKFALVVGAIIVIPTVIAAVQLGSVLFSSATITSVYGWESNVVATVEFDDAGAISSVVFDTSGETDGFGKPVGDNAEFAEQFIGFTTSSEVSVDVVAGATKTSNAAIDAVKLALDENNN